MIPLRKKVLDIWGAAPFTNPVSEFWYSRIIPRTEFTGGVPKNCKNGASLNQDHDHGCRARYAVLHQPKHP